MAPNSPEDGRPLEILTSNRKKERFKQLIATSEHKEEGEDMDGIPNQKRAEILKGLVHKAPKLELHVLSSSSLQKNQIITISCVGVEGGDSRRLAEDGYTYFGSQEREEEMEGAAPKNDIVIPAKNEASQEQFPGRHF